MPPPYIAGKSTFPIRPLVPMRFPPDLLDEIKARLPASSVIGRRVKLRRQGREFQGLSPFNQEKSPSFFVNDQKGAWFDFSAGKNGDIFTFLIETEGLTFPEAVERLAREAGVDLPKADPRAEERERKRASLQEVMEMATRFFEEELQSRSGVAARGYLQSRALSPEIQRRFRVGYAPPDRSTLKSWLAGNNVTNEQMVAAGLVISGDDIPVTYDRFRDRVMFPITDFRGAVVGFGGRALSSDVPAKYLNSPETELFHKGSLLYNGAEARKAARDAGTVVVVEGYVDVVRLVSAGFPHAVAPLGTALTERQLQILWRMAAEPILCFDGDKAGIRAAGRAADLALPFLEPGRSLRFALLPEGQDPDDLIRDAGREAMADVLKAARPLVDVLWGRETAQDAFDTPERRAALEARLREVARTIRDESVRRHYLQAFEERVAAFFPKPGRGGGAHGQWRSGSGERRDRDPAGRTPSAARASGIPVSDRLTRSGILAGRAALPLREAVLVATPVNHPALAVHHLDAFAGVELANAGLADLRAALLALVAEDEALDAAAVRARLAAAPPAAALLPRIDALLAAVGLWNAMPEAAYPDAERGWLQALTLHHRQRTLHKELRDAEAALANEPSEANFACLVDIQKQLANVEGMEALIEGFGSLSGRQSRTL